jgi:hypothetical protein
VSLKLGASAFSADYSMARARFRSASAARGFQLEAIPIGQQGPGGEELTIDVARLENGPANRAVLVSSGLHGVEGFFGSAVQIALLEQSDGQWPTPPDSAVVLIHALDPYGFAWLRRFDEENVDLNRNFLVNGDSYTGAPARYAELDGLLNPKCSPYRLDPFLLKAVAAIVRHGMPELKQAIAGGQYDYPHGLFFGGRRPALVQRILSRTLPQWLGDASRICHIDLHTGLGEWGTYQLLLEEGEKSERVDWLKQHFGADKVAVSRRNGSVYDTRGSLGRWCQASFPERNYIFACAEFGTYAPLRVVEALRAENQSHHWGTPNAPSTRRAKERLREVFAPSDPSWRNVTVSQAVDVVRTAFRACLEESLA